MRTLRQSFVLMLSGAVCALGGAALVGQRSDASTSTGANAAAQLRILRHIDTNTQFSYAELHELRCALSSIQLDEDLENCGGLLPNDTIRGYLKVIRDRP